MDSILTSIKKLLGISEEYENFDQDIRIHINTVFGVLHQLGIGPENGFFIEDKTALWYDYTMSPKLEMIKTYVYLKVRLIFDPPANSFLLDSINRQISELEWRLNVRAEGGM